MHRKFQHATLTAVEIPISPRSHDPDSHAERGRCRSGVTLVRYLLIDGTETPEDLREAITALRVKQRAACIASTKAEIGADIDELIDLLPRG